MLLLVPAHDGKDDIAGLVAQLPVLGIFRIFLRRFVPCTGLFYGRKFHDDYPVVSRWRFPPDYLNDISAAQQLAAQSRYHSSKPSPPLSVGFGVQNLYVQDYVCCQCDLLFNQYLE